MPAAGLALVLATLPPNCGQSWAETVTAMHSRAVITRITQAGVRIGQDYHYNMSADVPRWEGYEETGLPDCSAGMLRCLPGGTERGFGRRRRQRRRGAPERRFLAQRQRYR